MDFLGYCIICPLCLLAGFVDAIAGGGGLITVPAFLFAGLPVHNALGTNKLQAAMGTAIATLSYARQGYMDRGFVAVGVLCGLSGSACGTKLALATDDFAFRVIMLLILPVVAYYVLRTKDLGVYDGRPLPKRRALAVTAAVALLVGVYDGFYGPGTGTFLMLLLTALARQTLRQAAGTTKAVNLATNFASLSVFLWHGAALIPLGLVAGLFSIAGNWLGARFFTEKGSRIVRPIMLVVIVLFALRLVADIVGKVMGQG